MTPAQLAHRLRKLSDDLPAITRTCAVAVGQRSVAVLRAHTLRGGKLNRRSGLLANSVGTETEASGANVTVTVYAGRGTAVRYARIHEQGGTIVPKSGKYLAIPVGRARTAAGVTRGGWSSPRTAPVKLRFIPRVGGGLLVDASKKRGGVLYVLRRSVTIKAKWYMRDTATVAEAAIREMLVDRIVARIRG